MNCRAAGGVFGEDKAEQQTKFDARRMQGKIGELTRENDFYFAAGPQQIVRELEVLFQLEDLRLKAIPEDGGGGS